MTVVAGADARLSVVVVDEQTWSGIAARQHGVVAREQLLVAGLTRSAVRHRVAKGILEPLSARILRVVGSAPTDHQLAMAASLDASDSVVALHSAAALWELPGFSLEPVHVMTTRRPHRGTEHLGIVHSSVRFDESDVAVINGIRVTTPVRTLVDLSGRIHPDRVERVCDTMWARRLITYRHLHDYADRLPPRGGAPGARVIRRLAEARSPEFRPPESSAERRVNELLERAGVPELERQVDIGDKNSWIGRVDLADRKLRVLVEVQSELFHGSVLDQRNDQVRLARLRAAGWAVLEVQQFDIWHRPERVVEAISRLRASRRSDRADGRGHVA
jgi:very-short-patch-repair endonuclease/predicted transcriptional regulator of viral defense system